MKTMILASALALSATFGSAAKAAVFLYVGNAESNDISVFQLDSQSGTLNPTQTIAVPKVEKAGATSPMAVSPDKRTLFMGIRSEPYVAASFSIDPATGKLTHIGNGPLADSMAYISTDRAGRFLFAASYGGNKITVNPIGANGVIEAAKQVIPTGPNAHAIFADPANKFVLASSLGSDTVGLYKFDAATGTLSPNEPPNVKVKDKAGPRHFVFHPDGRHVYLINELDGTIIVFSYDAAKGALKELQTVSVMPPGGAKPWAADLHLTPDGKLLYGSERTTSTISAFKVGADGMLSPGGRVTTEKQPRGFNIDPSGRFLFAVGQLSTNLASYRIDPASGDLAPLQQQPVGKNPNWIEFVTLP